MEASPQASNTTTGGLPRWIWLAGGAVALTIAGVASALALQQRAQPAPAAVAATPAEEIVSPSSKPAARATTPTAESARGASPGQPAANASPSAAACAQCGVVESVQAVKVKGEAHGVGAVAGGVLGGVVGNQFGKGNGRTAMTVIGAVGGGVAGHEIEKNVKAKTVFSVRVRMDDGSLRTLQQSQAPAVGARVKVDGSTLRAA